MPTVNVPNFEFSAFYYPQLLEALLAYKRANVPELTDESDSEPSVQFMKSFALVGHLNNVLLDMIANEATLRTAQLPETIRNMLRLIGYELRPATPSTVDMLYKLARVFAVTTEIVPDGAQASTRRGDGDAPLIYFEASEAISTVRTDRVGQVLKYTALSGLFLDWTNNAVNGTPWDATLAVGDILYFGHANVMWDKLTVGVSVAPTSLATAVWEFHDGDPNDTAPDSVSNLGSSLQMVVNGLLGSANRAGAIIRVRLNSTGTYEDVESTWNGTQNVIVTTSLLGQSTPSISVSAYTVGSDWKELPALVDGTSLLTVSGDVAYTLPQNETYNWKKTTINTFEGYWLRLRCVETALGTGATLGLVRIDLGDQFALVSAVQGRSVKAETLGSSNGAENQRFITSHEGFILNSEEVRVDGFVWTVVTNFLSSASQDKHYVIELGENDRATIVFGDGVNGAIPPIGQGNVVVDYRFDARSDGNVGALTIVVDKQGLTYIEEITNPRAASGWAASQASSTEELERAKVAGPASLRVRDVAIGPDDLISLATSWIDSDGTSPFSRAIAIEEGFGPKTVELVLVGRGGKVPTPTQLANFQTYCNGDKTADPPVKKHFVANQQVVCTAFTPHPFDVTATVYAPPDVTAAQVVNQLASVLQPEARTENGVTFTWEFGGLVPFSRIYHEIFRTDPRTQRVILVIPATDTILGPRELPTTGVINITVVPTI